jgi:hypothetical protein
MLAFILEVISGKEGFYTRLFFLSIYYVVAAGFYSTVFPGISMGIYLLLGVAAIAFMFICFTWIAPKIADSYYFSHFQLAAMLLPIAAFFILLTVLFFTGVYAGG